MRFGKAQEQIFSSNDGAYSIVTERENFDSQITLTDYEAELVINHFGQNNLHSGNVQSNKALASKPFRLYPSGHEIRLNVVYPKPNKTELRLYISSRAGFKPDGGNVWFMFKKDANLWIGAMSERSWRAESSILKDDEFDAVYQASLDEPDSIRLTTLKQRDTYVRDRGIALASMKRSGFVCEYDAEHGLFVSRFSGKPYLEAHHLIPMGLQNHFKQPLDILDNVFCLCPNCHRAVHHAEESLAREMLQKLSSKRPILSNFSTTITDLFSHNVEIHALRAWSECIGFAGSTTQWYPSDELSPQPQPRRDTNESISQTITYDMALSLSYCLDPEISLSDSDRADCSGGEPLYSDILRLSQV